MTYSDLLRRKEWQERRQQIAELAGHQCQSCGRSEESEGANIGFEVHHKYYIRGRKPWEYSDCVFECLCRACHEEKTTINDLTRMAAGLMTQANQDLLLVVAKRILLRQRENTDMEIDLDDIPSELTACVDRDIDLHTATFLLMD